MARQRALLGLAAASLCLAAPASARPPTMFDPIVEAKNYSITLQRQALYDTPQYQLLLASVSSTNFVQALSAELSDPGRFFTNNLCWEYGNGCAGDVRLYDWAPNHYGLVQPVLFTARDGATLSGHVWMTKKGPKKRPGIVITDGSVQADETLYWFAAQALAKDGYIVLTFDPQGQGQSDLFGASPDTSEGVPAQSDGRPFFDGTEDALNFFMSNAKHPYEPVKSCSSGTSHAWKQNDRVKAGFDAAYNPFWKMLQRTQIGLAGHSYGAAGVSYIGQWDKRVKAIVAWDNLSAPDPSATGGTSGGPREQPCPGNPSARTVPKITKPALGMSADYFLPPEPNTSLPNPLSKSTESVAYSKAGVDTGEIIIKGGSHLDFSFIPLIAFGASLYGADMIDWYTTAWFDKYVKNQKSADKRLLTNRWRNYAPAGAIDPNHDPNMISFYYLSRLSIHRKGKKPFACEDLRDGCKGMVKKDGYKGVYSYFSIDTSPDKK